MQTRQLTLEPRETLRNYALVPWRVRHYSHFSDRENEEEI